MNEKSRNDGERKYDVSKLPFHIKKFSKSWGTAEKYV